MSFDIGGSARVSVPGFSASGSASAHVDGNPLAALGQAASAAVNAVMGGAQAGAAVGAQVGGAAGAALGGLLGASLASNLQSMMGTFEGLAGMVAAEFQGVTGMLTGNVDQVNAAARLMGSSALQVATLGMVRTGDIARAHTPPRPSAQLEMSGRVSVEGRRAWEADVSARFGVKHGGFSTTARAELRHRNDFNSVDIKGDVKLSLSDRASLRDTLSIASRTTVSTGGSVNASLGFDLSARAATNVALSPLLVMNPPMFLLLLGSRAEMAGGFAHLHAAMDMTFHFNGHLDIGRRPGAHAPTETRGTTGPKETRQPEGGISLDNPSSYLNNPALSFEDKVFLFCLSMAKKQENKIEEMMKKWEAQKGAAAKAKDGEGAKGADGKTPGPKTGAAPGGLPGLGAITGGAGGAGGGGGAGGLDLGGIVGIFKTLGPMALDLAATTAPLWVTGLSAACAAIPGVGPAIAAAGPMAIPLVQGGLSAVSGAIKGGALDGLAQGVVGAASGGGGAGEAQGAAQAPAKGAARTRGAREATSADFSGGTGDAAAAAGADEAMKGLDPKNKDSEMMFSQKLQKEQGDLTKMYEMCSNMMKAFHDSQMTAVRNLR